MKTNQPTKTADQLATAKERRKRLAAFKIDVAWQIIQFGDYHPARYFDRKLFLNSKEFRQHVIKHLAECIDLSAPDMIYIWRQVDAGQEYSAFKKHPLIERVEHEAE
jgi:hypothetical protein